MIRNLAFVAVVAFMAAGPALADPCTAIPDRGPMPKWLHKGSVFSGPVPYVGDGDSMCVNVGRPFLSFGPKGAAWVEVRLADFYAPEIHEPAGPAAKAALLAVVRGRVTTCKFDHRSYDRAVARCTIDGISIGDRLRAAGVREGGRGR